MKPNTIRVTKLDAARRQVATAIELWFNDGDAVSIHTLAFAAYEIAHVLSKNANPRRRDLLFDTAWIKDEFRGDWNRRIKDAANFFKHAKKEKLNRVLDFNPRISEGFIMFALYGVEMMGETLNATEAAFVFWTCLQEPTTLTDEGADILLKSLPVDALKQLRAMPKQQFLELFRETWHPRRRI